MKKKNIIVSSIITSIFLIGCGSSSGSSSSSTNAEDDTLLQIERGAILNATVLDNNGKIGKPISTYSNIYKFDNSIVYPVIVTSGVIDVNGNGEIDNEDIELKTTLKSSNSKITFISTIIYNEDKSIEKENLNKLVNTLKEMLNIESLNSEDLLDLPTNSKETMILTNALYKSFKEQSNQDNFFSKIYEESSTILEDIKSIISNLKTTFESSEKETLKEKAIELEMQVLNDLKTSNKISTLDEETIFNIKNDIESKSIYFDKKSLNNNSYFFLSSDKNNYFKLSFTLSDVTLESFSKVDEIWQKNDYNSSITYSVINSKINFNTTAQEEIDFLTSAFNNNFIFNNKLITQMPDELKDLSVTQEPQVDNNQQTNESSNTQEITYLLNRTFYQYTYPNGGFTIHEYKNSYSSIIHDYYYDYLTKTYKPQAFTGQSNILKDANTKKVGDSIVFEMTNYKQTLTIKEFHEDYIVINLKIETNGTLSSNTDSTWYTTAADWIPEEFK